MSIQDAVYIAPIVAAVAAAIAALASCRVAFVAHRAADAARASSKGQLLLNLLTEYGKEEMSEAVTSLSSWVRLSRTGERRELPEKQETEDIDKWRRRFSHYCQRVHTLHRLDLMDRESVRAAVSKGVAEVYLGIEPLEQRPGYDESSFEFFAALHGLPRNTTRPQQV